MTRRQTLLWIAVFAAMSAGLVVLAATGDLWRSSEERCVAVVQNMVQSGEWLVPHFEGKPRLQKPPLYYWLGAAVVKLTGAETLWTLRGLSVVVSLALAVTVFRVGRSLGGARTGLLAMTLLGTSALFYDRGRTGDAEPLLALFVFAALAVFERLWRTRDSRLLPVLGVLTGLGFLTKATAALLGIFAPIFAWLLVQQRLDFFRRPAVLAWGIVALAIGLAWYAAIILIVPGSDLLFSELLVSPFGVQVNQDARHLREFWYYWPRFPLNSAPTGLLLPWLAYEGWKRRLFRDEPALCFYALSFFVLFLAWTLVPAKQIHYLLALVPVQALVAARVIERRFLAKSDSG